MSKKEQKSNEPASAASPPLAPQPTPGERRRLPEWAKPTNPGKRFAMRTPNGGFNGERGGVKFQEGVGFTDDPAVAQHCRNLGYEVTDTEDEAAVDDKK